MTLTKKRLISTIIFFTLAYLAIAAKDSVLVKAADFYFFDQQSKILAPKLASDADIVIIMIDDYSLKKMSAIAGRWVWPRTVHAQLIEALANYHPQAIVFDILFAEKDIYRPDDDAYFNEVLATLKQQNMPVFFAMLQQNTIAGGGKLISQFPQQLGLLKTPSANRQAKASFILPYAINKEFWRLGTINFNADIDGIGRYYDVRRDIQGWQIKSLPAALVSSLNEPLPKQNSILLQWRGNTKRPFKTLSYVDVYQAIINDDEKFLQQLEHKIIVIGASASGLFDARTTAINYQLPGVYMLAMAIDNLKNQRFLTPLSDHIQFGLIVTLMLIIVACFMGLKNYMQQLLGALLSIISCAFLLMLLSQYLLAGQQLLFIGAALFFMVLIFMIFTLFYGYLEYQQRQRALTTFGRFLDPKVVYSLLKEDQLSADKLNKKQVVTVLFSDIRNFTQLSEKKAAEDIVKLLNDYFSQQVAIIFKHQGTLDKFIGDCIMAFWGAPQSNKHHASAAIAAALAMEQQLLIFRKNLPQELQDFDIGIGIHSGESIVGMIGADLRVDYTVIGDTVNLASRIEGLTKQCSRILVSEQTRLLAQNDFDFEYQGEHIVKGRTATVKLYRPIAKQVGKSKS